MAGSACAVKVTCGGGQGRPPASVHGQNVQLVPFARDWRGGRGRLSIPSWSPEMMFPHGTAQHSTTTQQHNTITQRSNAIQHDNTATQNNNTAQHNTATRQSNTMPCDSTQQPDRPLGARAPRLSARVWIWGPLCLVFVPSEPTPTKGTQKYGDRRGLVSCSRCPAYLASGRLLCLQSLCPCPSLPCSGLTRPVGSWWSPTDR